MGLRNGGCVSFANVSNEVLLSILAVRELTRDRARQDAIATTDAHNLHSEMFRCGSVADHRILSANRFDKVLQ